MVQTGTSYSQMLKQRVKDTVVLWESQEQLSNKDMFQFFHSLKGTAGTVGLHEWSEIAGKLLYLFEETSEDLVSSKLRNTALQKMKNLLIEDEQLVAHSEVVSTLLEEKYFVLIIDNDIEFVRLVKDTLETENIGVLIAPTAKKGLEMFFTLQPNFVLIDLLLPDDNGFNILKQISAQARQHFIPLAITSSNKTKEAAKEAYELGATDFIGKPLDIDIFVPYVNNRIQNKEKILHSIATDELTGAFNRKQLTSSAPYHIQMHKQLGKPLSIAMLDLDNFKKVNDTYGHLVGDEVLKEFAKAIQNECDQNEILFRYGGEEFTILFLNKTADEADKRVNLFRKAISAKYFSSTANPFKMTFSVGISCLHNNQTHIKQLLEEADYALYQSKHSGRNCTTLFTEEKVPMIHKRSLNIFIIDDDPIVGTLLVSQFLNWHHPRFEIIVTAINDGREFVGSNWYHEGQDHILLLDSLMPSMSGIEVLDHVRTNYPSKNVLISMLSAQKEEEKILQALHLGADDYLLKPFHTKEVILRIQRLAERLFLS
ncbi:diguanylate cyclase [Paenisporosarcina sp. TG-14]|uniref:diguanylate cyclase n=1 Tax=Paenisporosarcina sp. TG-14 TaxID=1231057 RepID=UPI000374373F|nr:diguanylate cyclase [Paenisporosarcina sp. TG-14]